jgi:hypothetical protein
MPPRLPVVPLALTLGICAYVLLVVWVTLRGLDIGLTRSGCATPIRRSLLTRVGALLAIWFLAVTAGAVSGAYLEPGFPRAAGYTVPILVLSLVMWRAGWLRAAVGALELSAIPWLQTLRIGGGLTLYGAWSVGLAPWGFVGTAGLGDVLVGLGAAGVAVALSSGASWALGAARVWNVLGLLDIAHTLFRAITSAPGPQQLFHEPPPNLVPAVFPFLYLPAFIVPLTILLHLLSLQQLADAREGSTRTRRASPPSSAP